MEVTERWIFQRRGLAFLLIALRSLVSAGELADVADANAGCADASKLQDTLEGIPDDVSDVFSASLLQLFADTGPATSAAAAAPGAARRAGRLANAPWRWEDADASAARSASRETVFAAEVGSGFGAASAAGNPSFPGLEAAADASATIGTPAFTYSGATGSAFVDPRENAVLEAQETVANADTQFASRRAPESLAEASVASGGGADASVTADALARLRHDLGAATQAAAMLSEDAGALSSQLLRMADAFRPGIAGAASGNAGLSSPVFPAAAARSLEDLRLRQERLQDFMGSTVDDASELAPYFTTPPQLPRRQLRPAGASGNPMQTAALLDRSGQQELATTTSPPGGATTTAAASGGDTGAAASSSGSAQQTKAMWQLCRDGDKQCGAFSQVFTLYGRLPTGWAVMHWVGIGILALFLMWGCCFCCFQR